MVKTSSSELNPAFYNGQVVWLKVNNEFCGMVTGIVTRPGGWINYLVVWSSDAEEKCHFACELSSERLFSDGND